MYSTSQMHKDKSKIILFISNDGKENAREVLACKCDHIVCDMLVSWSLARIYYRLPSSGCYFQQNMTVSDIYMGAGKLRLQKLIWEHLQ